MEKPVRNSNHELLRIIAMYMIIFVHANMHLMRFCPDQDRVIFGGVVNGICNIGVSCFILISGYYGIRFSLRKLVKMECMMITYSLLETAILYAIMPEQLQGAALLEQLVKSMLPFISRKYWFYSCYVCLFLLSGYIQKLLDLLKRKELERLLCLLVILFSVLPTLFYFELVPDNGKGLVQMIMVYMIGRYIHAYKDIRIPTGKAVLCFFLLWVINGVSHELPIRVGDMLHHLCKDNSITNLAMAILLFYIFKNLQFHSKAVNRISSYIFAVFALNNTFVTLAMSVLDDCGFQSPGHFPGFLILAGVVFGILILCLAIGAIRELILGKADHGVENFVEKAAGKLLKVDAARGKC